MAVALSSKVTGDIVKLNGVSFHVIAQLPEGTKVRQTGSVATRIYNPEVNGASKNDFNLTYGMGSYLNNNYYNTLSSDVKAMVVDYAWHTGPTGNEESIKVLAKVGLLTVNDVYQVGVKYGGPIPYLVSKHSWLLTPGNASYLTYYINGYESTINTSTGRGKVDSGAINNSSSNTFEVQPVIVLRAGLTVGDDGTVLPNSAPTVTLNTPNNATLYENDTFKIDGQASDSDNGNIVNVKYQIGAGTVRAIATGISDGATAIGFNEQLTFKNGKLFKGVTEITGALSEGTAHQLKVWSEDDKGGKSVEQIRTFYVVPNRAPAITVDTIANQSDLINSDKVTITGSTSDLDGNDVVVKYKVNNSLSIQIHSGPAGPWTFDLSLKDLKDGDNNIVVEVSDSYSFKTSKTIKLNKTPNATPLSKSVQRYNIVSPTGSAQGVLLWIQREATQVVSAEISMTNGTEQESYSPMTLSNTAPVSLGIVEDQFEYQASEAKGNINVKFNITGTGAVTLVSGVLS